MNDAVSPNKPKREKTDFLTNARNGWGDALPDWVVALAKEATRTSGAAVGARLGYSPAVVSDVVRGKYKGAVGVVEQKVRGAFMGYVVACPVLGEIARDYCIQQQSIKSAASANRTRLYRACRRGCEHSRLASNIEEVPHA